MDQPTPRFRLARAAWRWTVTPSDDPMAKATAVAMALVFFVSWNYDLWLGARSSGRTPTLLAALLVFAALLLLIRLTGRLILRLRRRKSAGERQPWTVPRFLRLATDRGGWHVLLFAYWFPAFHGWGFYGQLLQPSNYTLTIATLLVPAAAIMITINLIARESAHLQAIAFEYRLMFTIPAVLAAALAASLIAGVAVGAWSSQSERPASLTWKQNLLGSIVADFRALTADTVLWAYLAELDLIVIDPPTSPTKTPAASP